MAGAVPLTDSIALLLTLAPSSPVSPTGLDLFLHGMFSCFSFFLSGRLPRSDISFSFSFRVVCPVQTFFPRMRVRELLGVYQIGVLVEKFDSPPD